MSDLLDTISAIIEGDVQKIAKKAKTEQLDRTSASNLVDYAKLQIAVDKHQKELEVAAEEEALKAEEYEELKAKAAKLIADKKV